MTTISERLRATDLLDIEPVANEAADTIDALVAALDDAADFIQPFNRAEELLGRIEDALAKAKGKQA